MQRNYNDPQYKIWRQKVYKRDKFSCQWPNCTSKKKLNAHHIKTWSNCPALRYVVDNGITLCSIHHKLIKGLETYYEAAFLSIAKKNNNEQQRDI